MNIHLIGAFGFIGRYVRALLPLFGHTETPLSKSEAVIHLGWRGLPNYESENHFANVPEILKQVILARAYGVNNITIAGTCLESVPNPPAYARAKKDLLDRLWDLPGINLKWLRLFYIHGHGQKPQGLLPQLKQAMREGKKEFHIASAVREFMSVEEAASYLIRAAQQTLITGIIDCSPGHPETIRGFCTRNSSGLDLIEDYQLPEYEPYSIVGNSRKLASIP